MSDNCRPEGNDGSEGRLIMLTLASEWANKNSGTALGLSTPDTGLSADSAQMPVTLVDDWNDARVRCCRCGEKVCSPVPGSVVDI